jgi:hypothetical protein
MYVGARAAFSGLLAQSLLRILGLLLLTLGVLGGAALGLVLLRLGRRLSLVFFLGGHGGSR